MKIIYRLIGKYALIEKILPEGEHLSLDFGKKTAGSVALGEMRLILRDGTAVCPKDALGKGGFSPVLYLSEGAFVCEPFTVGNTVTADGPTHAMLTDLFRAVDALAGKSAVAEAKIAALDTRVNGTALL